MFTDIYNNERIGKSFVYTLLLKAKSSPNVFNTLDKQLHRSKRKVIGQYWKPLDGAWYCQQPTEHTIVKVRTNELVRGEWARSCMHPDCVVPAHIDPYAVIGFYAKPTVGCLMRTRVHDIWQRTLLLQYAFLGFVAWVLYRFGSGSHLGSVVALVVLNMARQLYDGCEPLICLCDNIWNAVLRPIRLGRSYAHSCIRAVARWAVTAFVASGLWDSTLIGVSLALVFNHCFFYGDFSLFG